MDPSHATALSRGPEDPPPDEEVAEFLGLLNELKATGSNLLVVGDEPRCAFTRASERLFGDPAAVRYRLLAVTDATGRSVVERLPDPESTPRPVRETTHVLTHAGTPRSVVAPETADEPVEHPDLREAHVADPDLHELESAVLDGVEAFADSATLRPGDLRVGVDSITSLLDDHGENAVRRCLTTIGRHVREYDGMAHYVLPEGYDSTRVQSLSGAFDAVIEVRTVSADDSGRYAEERWHVPDADLTMQWTRL